MLHVGTIDTGATVARLRAFGPPEVVALDLFAGNASGAEQASGFWEQVLAVSLLLTADATVVTRSPRVTFLADEPVPCAQVVSAFGRAAGGSSRFTFAVGVQQAGALSGPSIVSPLPELLLLPGWSVVLDVLGGAAGDQVSSVRVYRQRFELVDVV